MQALIKPEFAEVLDKEPEIATILNTISLIMLYENIKQKK
jgi:hypothetical protein